ncbi:hypothetical protein M427DRAFT_453916 [Gonapodya prolifera JEL478]|uniref:Conserved oligomeric Golgi complex subunit 1 n=1 Tax=Gonapodya prolifera (strain JEL478) TaxID=1344416 RepID=A0A139AS64_GONPJ|nr:hypothetical protein M427DRAFT_453916 [Gonapodya prolifera JEL478]|eukprot:KXS19591.1 hypothetical protein M427DRAFT_453916 [Gonapodya prolifera JEL478]
MVGESYRDIIAASQSISDMQSLSRDVGAALTSVRDTCDSNSLKNKATDAKNAGKDLAQEEKKRLFYPIAAQIKLLVDTPEELWYAIESHEYLQAAHAFLLAKLVYRNLQTSAEGAILGLKTTFPVVQRQWDAIAPFRQQILFRTRSHLRHPSSHTPRHVARTLVAWALLDQAQLATLLAGFLDERARGVAEVVRGNAPQGDPDTPHLYATLRTASRAVSGTIRHAALVFAPDPVDGRCAVWRTYADEVEGAHAHGHGGSHHIHGHHHRASLAPPDGALSPAAPEPPRASTRTRRAHAVARHLPSAVVSYRPVMDARDTLALEDLRKATGTWLDGVLGEARTGLATLLGGATTAEAWREARAGVVEEVRGIESGDREGGGWDKVCHTALNRPFRPWHNLFRPIFRARAEALVEEAGREVGELPKTRVHAMLQQLEEGGPDSDLAAFIWTPTPAPDVPAPAGAALDADVAARIRVVAGRAVGVTPVVEAAAAEFEAAVRKVKACVRELVKEALEERAEREGLRDEWGFREDANGVVGAYEKIVADAVERYREGLLGLLAEERRKFDVAESVGEKKAAIDRAIVVGRIARAVSSRNPTGVSKPGSSRTLRGAGLSLDQRIVGADQGPRQALLTVTRASFSMWLVNIAQGFGAKLVDGFEFYYRKHPYILPESWEAVVIQGEADGGQTEEAKLLLPTFASRFIIDGLYDVCTEITRLGGYLIEVSTIRRALILLARSAFTFYTAELDQTHPRLGEQLLLQLLFDIRYLVRLFQGCWLASTTLDVLPGEEPLVTTDLESLANEALAAIRKEIDPIELTVADSHLTANVDRFYVRNATLLGPLLVLNPRVIEPKRPTTYNESYNALPVAAQAPRFPMSSTIPLSTATFQMIPLSQQVAKAQKAPPYRPPRQPLRLTQHSAEARTQLPAVSQSAATNTAGLFLGSLVEQGGKAFLSAGSTVLGQTGLNIFGLFDGR